MGQRVWLRVEWKRTSQCGRRGGRDEANTGTARRSLGRVRSTRTALPATKHRNGQMGERLICRSKYHVPLQSVNVVLTFIGAFLGHHHHGREFPETVRWRYLRHRR